MDELAAITVFVTFFAVVGPPKILIAFAHLSRERTPAEMRRLTLVSSLVAAAVGVVIAYSADLLTSFFHVSDQALFLAGGVIFFVYAVALVLGTHLGGGPVEDEEDSSLVSGLRELLLPYIVSPLAVTAELVESLDEDTWSWRTTVALMYLAVLVVDFLCIVVLIPLLPRIHVTALEVLSRVLGLLLAAVGVEVFLHGLEALGVHMAPAGF
jgi:multiple antibiotic resistance protein